MENTHGLEVFLVLTEDDHAILVNLTGGGAERAHADGIAIPASPDYVFTKSQDNLDDIRKVLAV